MKLVIIIPAHNEEISLDKLLPALPKQIRNITEIEPLLIDDGSSDLTEEVAKKHGVKVFAHHHQKGLAQTFQDGLNEALKLGADVIVNIDGDNQYNPAEIEALVQALIQQKADLAVGDRMVKTLNFMPWLKKYGNIWGSFFLRRVTGLKVNDASSGFRALTREAALKTQVLSSHTYTHETLIQAVFLNFKVVNVPVEFRARVNGKSKLIDNVFGHIWKSLGAILRALVTYKPFKKFMTLGGLFFLIGLFFEVRYLIFFLKLEGEGHVQSVILGAIFILFGVMLMILAFIADLIVANRKIQNEILYRIKKEQYAKPN